MAPGAVPRRPTLQLPLQPQLRLDPGCVVSYCPIASSLGARVLLEGGNAVDAAVATGLALAVTYPQAGNIGGGGFMLIHADGDVHMLDYRERAPARADAALYDDEGSGNAKSLLGPLAVAVPGTIAGLAEAHARFGSRPWADIVDTVVPLADAGVWLTTRQASALRLYGDSLAQFASTRRYFLAASGAALSPGILFRQQDLAGVLRAVGERGARGFYEGRVADQIVGHLQQLGGVLDHEDLAAYRPAWRRPLHRRYRDHDVYLPSLPSAGGLVVSLALGCAEATDAERLEYGSARWAESWMRIFRVAFAAANRLACDPSTLDPAEVEATHAYVQRELRDGGLERLEAEWKLGALAGDPVAAVRPSTTHFSILDRGGMAVSNTYSVNTLFGSKLAVDGAGFLLNNTMADFRIATGPNWYGLLQGDRNRIGPGRRPASSMTPTLVLKDGKAVMVLGGSGGPRIPTAVAQVIATVLGTGQSLSESIRRPRVHHQLFPDDLLLEKGFDAATLEALRAAGNPVSEVKSLSVLAAIRRKLEDDELSAVLDQRFGDFW